MEKNAKTAHSLEREVISAVIILYILICGTMLAIHYLQPEGQETVTSSTSPSHEGFYAEDLTGKAAAPLTQVEAHTLLTRQGYQEIRGLRAEGSDGFVAQAIKGGKLVDVTVNGETRAIAHRTAATH